MNEEKEIEKHKNDAKERARNFLFNRQRSYVQTFDPASEPNAAVLSDLAKFCRANATTFHPDPRVHALMEGRREVWLRIQKHLKLDSETLWKIISREGA